MCVVPGLAKPTNQRLFQKLIDPHLLAPAQHLARLADFPAVIVHGREVGILLQPYGVEVARDGFVEIDLPGPEGLLDGTLAHAVPVVAGKDAILTVDNRGHQVALLIDIGHPLLLDYPTGLGQQIVPHHPEYLFELAALLLGDRRPRVAFDTTGPQTLVEVTDKKTFYDVEAHQSTAYL